jgi:hypothetical protein
MAAQEPKVTQLYSCRYVHRDGLTLEVAVMNSTGRIVTEYAALIAGVNPELSFLGL